MEEKLHASSSAVLHHSHIHTYIERISSLEPAAVELSSAAQILGGLASAFQSACYGRIANDYAGGRQEAMQDCVKLAGSTVSWISQGVATAMALEAPTTCSSLKDFVVAALELASYAFFSTEWYSALGPQLYVTLGNAARAYVKDLAPAALEAADACWRAVEPQLDTCGGQERLAACRALVAGLADGLRLLAKKSAESINDPQVPREMRSFGGVNVLWTSLTRALTGLPPDGMPQLLSGGVVAAVLRGLLGHLVAEARALPGSGPADFDTRIKVARFWLQHIVKTVQAHPAAGAGCWPELCAAASEMYRHIASCGYAATGAGAAAAGASGQAGSQQPGAGAGPGAGAAASPHARAAQDLESVVMLKLTSLIAMTLEAAAPVLAWSGFPAAGAPPAGPGASGHQPGLVAAVLPASQHDIQERLSQLEALARPSSASGPSTLPAAAPPPPPAACCGAVMLALALMQRAAHLGPDTRAAMAGRLLPWAGHAVSTRLYDLALELGGPAAAAPCLDLPHQLAAAALTLTAVAADAASHPHHQQHQHHPQPGAAPAAAPPPPGGQDVDTFQVACGVLCNWGSCAHPLLSTAAADVLSTLVAHCQPALGGRLIAAVARLAGLAAAAEAAAAVAVGHVVEGAGAARRLERLLASMIAAAPPGAGAAWRQVLDPHLHFSATHGSAAGPDTCSAATARALWGAAAGAAGAAAAAAAAGHAAPTAQGSAGPPLGSGRGCVTEQELAARASQLLTAVKQATAILTAAAPGAGGTPAAAAAASLLQPWLAQLLGCLEVTVAHAQSLATCSGAGAGVGAGAGGSGGGGATICSALQPLVAQAGAAAVELLQTLSEDAVNTTSCGVSGTPASLQAAHAAVRLLARAAPAMPPAALAEAAPALTRVAEAGPPEVVADVAAAAEFCTSPPPEALFHVLLRHAHPAVTHAALHSKIRICRTVPEQHKPALRRLLPPDPSGAPGPPPHLTALIKSYWSRRLSDEEAAAPAAAALAPRARAAEAARLEGAAREACLPDSGLGWPAASSALQRAVSQGGEALTAAATTLAAAAAASSAAAAASAAASCAEADMVCEGGLAGLGATAPSAAGAAAGGGAASGPLKGFIADDKAAVGGVAAALGGLEGCLRALAAAVRAQGLHPGRPSQDWDQLQAHVRALLGDLCSASSRIRTCTDMLHSLQGR